MIILLAIIKLLLPFILLSPVYELQRDELLYYQQGIHPAWGYLENPPLTGWLATISSWLGGSQTVIRIWPALFGSATLVLVCLLAAEWGGRRFAQFLAGVCMLCAAMMRVHLLFQPNILDIFSWTLAIYCIARFINEQRLIFLYAFVGSLVIGFYGKYSVFFAGAGLFASLLLSKHRSIFAKKQFYIAAAIGIVLILPNVWWQYSHNWPLIHHMEELQDTQLKYTAPGEFLKEQLMMLLPVVFIWMGGLIWLLARKQWRFVGLTYLIIIGLLLAGRGKAYYALGIYPALLAAGGVAWEQLLQKRWVIARYAISLFIIGFSFLIIPLIMPVWAPEKLAAVHKRHNEKHVWEDRQEHPLPQDFADMLGWKEAAQKTESFYQSLPAAVKDSIIIFAGNYGYAGALQLYAQDPLFKQKVIATNGSFLLWLPKPTPFRHFLFLGEASPEDKSPVFQNFRRVLVADSITNTYSRQRGNKLFFFEDGPPGMSEMAWAALQQQQKKFSR